MSDPLQPRNPFDELRSPQRTSSNNNATPIKKTVKQSTPVDINMDQENMNPGSELMMTPSNPTRISTRESFSGQPVLNRDTSLSSRMNLTGDIRSNSQSSRLAAPTYSQASNTQSSRLTLPAGTISSNSIGKNQIPPSSPFGANFTSSPAIFHNRMSDNNRGSSISSPMVYPDSPYNSQRHDLHSNYLHHSVSTDPTDPDTVIWGTSVNIQKSIRTFREFMKNFTLSMRISMDNREQGTNNETVESDHLAFYPRLLGEVSDSIFSNQMLNEEINYLNLDCSNMRAYPPAEKLRQQLIKFPQEIIPIMDFVVSEIYGEIHSNSDKQIVVRPFNLEKNVSMRELDPSGLVIRASPIIPDMKKGFFKCFVCDQTITADIDRGRIYEPTTCPNQACNAPNTMRLCHNRCEFSNKQIARMQELPNETPDGQTPNTVTLYIYDSLMDVCKPGDRVEITGIHRAVPLRLNPRTTSIKAQFKTYLDVLHIKTTSKTRIGVDKSISQQPENITDVIEDDAIQTRDFELEARMIHLSKRPGLYDILCNSLAPSICGMDDVKKGILLQLFGGCNKFNGDSDNGTRIRGDLNVLIVGDPGVSKSQLLKYVHAVAPRGVYTSGKGSSAVGLTAYITRDPDTKQQVLESGALVMSDGGICCIDEFDKMSDSTRSVLHEVMEQQTISIAKAGIITTLNARTSILACANPIRSKFDSRLSVVENINIPPPLLSRFDLVYLVLDQPNEKTDRQIANFLIGLYLEDQTPDLNILKKEEFAQYVKFAKSQPAPALTQESSDLLLDYYIRMRKWGKDAGRQSNVVSATTRQLESMIRLSEAHAKMRLSRFVQGEDVIEAHRLISEAMHKAYIDPRTGCIDMDMINTGVSRKNQLDHQALLDSVSKAILDHPSVTIKFVDLLRKMNEILPTSENQLKDVIEILASEGGISVRGKNNGEKIILKNSGLI